MFFELFRGVRVPTMFDESKDRGEGSDTPPRPSLG
jgi:hypothetical protein